MVWRFMPAGAVEVDDGDGKFRSPMGCACTLPSRLHCQLLYTGTTTTTTTEAMQDASWLGLEESLLDCQVVRWLI